MLECRATLRGIWIIRKKLTAVLVNVDKLINERNQYCLENIKEQERKQMILNLLELITTEVKLN